MWTSISCLAKKVKCEPLPPKPCHETGWAQTSTIQTLKTLNAQCVARNMGSLRLWPNMKVSFRSTISCLSSRNSHMIALSEKQKVLGKAIGILTPICPKLCCLHGWSTGFDKNVLIILPHPVPYLEFCMQMSRRNITNNYLSRNRSALSTMDWGSSWKTTKPWRDSTHGNPL